MPQEINEKKYNAMISALYTYARDTKTTISELSSSAQSVANVLGTDDDAIAKITADINTISDKYELAAAEAVRIASLMQQELEEAQRRERNAWDD
ncbi:MAG: hypothetical protein IJH71_05640 [Eubacterium sp.]|nr:hypothetical protein [Eubacterium sp.]